MKYEPEVCCDFFEFAAAAFTLRFSRARLRSATLRSVKTGPHTVTNRETRRTPQNRSSNDPNRRTRPRLRESREADAS